MQRCFRTVSNICNRTISCDLLNVFPKGSLISIWKGLKYASVVSQSLLILNYYGKNQILPLLGKLPAIPYFLLFLIPAKFFLSTNVMQFYLFFKYILNLLRRFLKSLICSPCQSAKGSNRLRFSLKRRSGRSKLNLCGLSQTARWNKFIVKVTFR